MRVGISDNEPQSGRFKAVADFRPLGKRLQPASARLWRDGLPLFRRTRLPTNNSSEGGTNMFRALGAATLVAIVIAAPVQDAAAQDPLGGALLGGAAGAIVGGALGGGRGAAVARSSVVRQAPLLPPRASRDRAATVTMRMVVIGNVAMERGSWSRQIIAPRRQLRSRLLHDRLQWKH